MLRIVAYYMQHEMSFVLGHELTHGSLFCPRMIRGYGKEVDFGIIILSMPSMSPNICQV